MFICKYCGSESPDGTRVCPSCSSTEFDHKCNNCGQFITEGIYCPRCGVKAGTIAKHCPRCGTEYFSKACPDCGYIANGQTSSETYRTVPPPPWSQPAPQPTAPKPEGKPKDKVIALILCILFGTMGIHKFYEGKIGMGILYLCTGGLFYIGWIVDIIKLAGKPSTYYVK